MVKVKKIVLTTLFVSVCVVLSLGTSWAARKNVIIAEQSWTGSTVICQVMKYVLENKLDIPVKITQLNGSVTWVGMDKGDVDVFSDIWETAEIEGIKKYTEEKKTCEVVLSYANAPQGWYIPKFAAEEHGIKTIEDLKGKEKLFDIDGNGKGDLWGGPTSWKVNEITSIKIRDYGLDFENLGFEQWAWLATLKAAILKKNPVIFITGNLSGFFPNMTWSRFRNRPMMMPNTNMFKSILSRAKSPVNSNRVMYGSALAKKWKNAFPKPINFSKTGPSPLKRLIILSPWLRSLMENKS